MKDIYKLLDEVGLSVSEDKKADFDNAVKENYKTIAEVEKIATARDNYKSQLETARETLKGFEGVDVAELKGKIENGVYLGIILKKIINRPLLPVFPECAGLQYLKHH